MGMALRSRLLGLCCAGVGTARADVVWWAANGAEGRERLARLAGNWFGVAGVEALARALPQMAQLTTLNLSGTTSPALCALIA